MTRYVAFFLLTNLTDKGYRFIFATFCFTGWFSYHGETRAQFSKKGTAMYTIVEHND